jgi:hypothetical protein
MSTAPIFAPDGTLGDVPQEQFLQAVRAGAKPGVNIIAPDGSHGVVPADRTADAVKAGAKVLPYEQQDVQHPGFWKSLTDDLKGMATGAYHAVTDYDPLSDPKVPDDAKWKIAQQMSAQAEAKITGREAVGYGKVYSNVSAPAAEMLGVNVPGMEQSAREGDVGGVAGHAAAVPTVLAATEGLTRGVGAALERAPAAIKAVRNVTPKQAAQVAGGAGGAVAGHGPLSAPGKERANTPIFERYDPTAENTPYAGEKTPPLTGEPDATGENKPYAGEPAPEGAAKIPAKALKQSQALGPNTQTLQQAEALRGSTHDVVDSHISPDANRAENFQAKREIDFHLGRGDVAGAEAALDQAAAKVNPQYAPSRQTDPAPTAAEAEPDTEVLMRLGTTEPPEPTPVQGVGSKLGTPEEEARFRQAMEGRGAAKQDLESGKTPIRNAAAARAQGTNTPEGVAQDQDFIAQAKAELGPNASASDILQRAQAKKMALPGYFDLARQVVPSVENIRENLAQTKAAEASAQPGGRPDLMEDKALQQEMNQDLQRHGWRVESEARREFIARNSTGQTKGGLIEAAKSQPAEENLAPEWAKTLEYLMKKKRGEIQ